MEVGAPLIDIGPLVGGRGDASAVAAAIDAACRHAGFFSIVGHGVDPQLIARVDRDARAFFALDDETKSAIAMAHGGSAWRGWFPLGGELTDGIPDGKEGLYFGAELDARHPKVRAGVPLHGPNLFPATPAELRGSVLAYLDAMTRLGHALARGVSLALGRPADWFDEHLTADPMILFRIFRYPPGGDDGWGVAEHTDYGLLTVLHQDDAGGLQVHAPGGWVDVDPVPGALVCNLGDMLERLTGGAYRSTPHRVRNTSRIDRVSLAFFFDPAWDAPIAEVGTYGDYLQMKVARVFPALRDHLG